LIMAEAIQCIVSFATYTQDIEHVGKKRVAVDRFSADMRICGCGDCEDQAHENVILWRSLLQLKPRILNVQRIQEIALQYIMLEILGTIKLPYSPELQVYSTGTMYAHAYVMLFPTSYIRKCLGKELDLHHSFHPSFSEAPILTIDSTRNNDPNCLKPSYPWQCPLKMNRVRGIEAIDNDHYLYLSSAYSPYGILYANTSTNCPELFFVNSQGQRGCAYNDVIGGSIVSFRPTVQFETFQQLEPRVTNALKLLHPIPAYDVATPPPRLNLKTTFVGNKKQVGELFLDSNNCKDRGFLEEVRSRARDDGYAVVEELEFLAQPWSWGIRILLFK